MKNVSERGENIKAWKAFIQTLTVESLLGSYISSQVTVYYTVGTKFDDGGNEIGLQTYGDYMTILCGGVWYVFSTPIGLWDRNIHMEVDRELLRMLDFEVVKDFIKVVEL